MYTTTDGSETFQLSGKAPTVGKYTKAYSVTKKPPTYRKDDYTKEEV